MYELYEMNAQEFFNYVKPKWRNILFNFDREFWAIRTPKGWLAGFRSKAEALQILTQFGQHYAYSKHGTTTGGSPFGDSKPSGEKN